MDSLQQGFTLMEVVVSLFLLFVIFVGYEKIQLVMTEETIQYYYDSIALQQLKNLSAYFASYVDHPIPPFNIATFHNFLNRWNQDNKLLLPHGHSTVTVAYPHYQATLVWGLRYPPHSLSITQ